MKKAIQSAMLTIAAAMLLAGCASHTEFEMQINPSVQAYPNYANQVPGRFALYINADKMKGASSSRDAVQCSYQVDAISQFLTASRQTFENVLERVEVVSAPVDHAELRSNGYDGIIVAEALLLEIDTFGKPGWDKVFWDAETEIVVKVAMDDASGRVVETTVEGIADAKGEFLGLPGGFCGDVGTLVLQSVDEAMARVQRNLADRVIYHFSVGARATE